MICDVCGQEFGVSHNCPGMQSEAARRILTEDLQAPPNGGFAYYLSEAVKILSWDHRAIRRNALDPRATKYGFMVFFAAVLLIGFVAPRIPGATANPLADPQSPAPYGLLSGMTYGIAGMVALTFLQITICHAISKWLLDGKAKFVELLRPLLLGWLVNCLLLVPGRGLLFASIGWTAVLMVVFEEIEGIERMKAFCICAGVNFTLFAIRFAMTPVTHHL